jgi:DNA polymerase-3 subunit alpha (Gram-positive type)
MVKDAPTIEEVLPLLKDFIGDAALVAHNAPFDMGFILEKAKKVDLEIHNPHCRYPYSFPRTVKDLKRHSLNSVAKYLGIPQDRHHRALDDAKTTGAILIRLFELLETKGVKNCAI